MSEVAKIAGKRVPIYQVRLERSGSLVSDAPVCNTASTAAAVLRDFIGDSPVEVFTLIVLDARSRMIGIHEVSKGTLSASLVHPREVFKVAILLNGAAVIVAHNHPSGDPAPSSEDRDATKRLQRAGEVIGIPVVDHIVVGQTDHFSFRERGLL